MGGVERKRRRYRLLKSIVWGTLLAISLWLYFFPVDYFQPESRSEKRPTPVAFEQRHREKEIVAEVKELVLKIQKLWTEKYPDEPMGELAPPAPESEIEELERLVGPLPLDFKAFLRIANGHTNRGGRFFGYQPLLNCKRILEDSRDLAAMGQDYQEIPLTHADVWFHPGALIFEEQDGGGYAINAANGVVYNWDHEGGSLSPVAHSFQDMLRRMLACLEADGGPGAGYTRWDLRYENKK